MKNTMAFKLSVNEKRELDKFSKFLALKTVQIIVQSRVGHKVITQCSPKTSQADWFNLAIPDDPTVLEAAKNAINGEFLTARVPLCVEISLQTVDGDSMVLESWCLNVSPERCDPHNRITHTVYNHMGLLLKSLISVTRVIPAYKLSRRQSLESYIVCYRIYMDEPDLGMLGEGFKQIRIGQICTPLGTLQLGVSYRTKMTISPTNADRGQIIMVKSDHFEVNISPKQKPKVEEKLEKAAPFADDKWRNYKSEIKTPEIPFGNLLSAKIPQNLTKNDENGDEEDKDKVLTSSPMCSNKTTESTEDKNGNTPTSEETETETETSNITMVSTNDDFIMVELKSPFANENAKTELGQFIREWQAAPPLKAFSEVPSIAEQVQDLSKQLESFESDMHKYEDVIQSIVESPNNN